MKHDGWRHGAYPGGCFLAIDPDGKEGKVTWNPHTGSNGIPSWDDWRYICDCEVSAGGEESSQYGRLDLTLDACKRECSVHDDQCTGFVYKEKDGGCFWKGGNLSPKPMWGHVCYKVSHVELDPFSEDLINSFGR